MESRPITYSQVYTIRKWLTAWNDRGAEQLIQQKYPTLEAGHKLISQGPRSSEMAALKKEYSQMRVAAGREILNQSRGTV